MSYSSGIKEQAISIINKSSDSGWSDIYEIKNATDTANVFDQVAVEE